MFTIWGFRESRVKGVRFRAYGDDLAGMFIPVAKLEKSSGVDPKL